MDFKEIKFIMTIKLWSSVYYKNKFANSSQSTTNFGQQLTIIWQQSVDNLSTIGQNADWC